MAVKQPSSEWLGCYLQVKSLGRGTGWGSLLLRVTLFYTNSFLYWIICAKNITK